MWRNRRQLHHFPGTCRKPIGFVIQRTDRTQVDNISGQLMIDTFLYKSANHCSVTTPHRAQFLNSGYFPAEADTARAQDTAGHIRRNQRANILILHNTFAFGIPGYPTSIAHGQVLQFTLTTLITNRAIQRMVDQQKLHDGFLRANRGFRSGKDLHAIGYRSCTGRQGFRRFLNFNQAHPAIGRHRQVPVIAKPRHIYVCRISHLDQHLTRPGFQFYTVDFDFKYVRTHNPETTLFSTTIRRPDPGR